MAAGDAENPIVQGVNDGSESNAALMKIAQALLAASAGVGGHALANANSQSSIPPQLLQLLDNSVARQGYQNPLFQATTKGTFDMLPTFAKEGSALSGTLPSVLPPAQPWTGGSGGPGVKTAAGLGGAATLAALLGNGGGGGGALGPLLKKIRDLFGHHGTPAPGNPSAPNGMGPDTLPGNGTDPNFGVFGPDYGPQTPNPMPNVDTTYDFPYLGYEPGGPDFVGPMPSGSPNGDGDWNP